MVIGLNIPGLCGVVYCTSCYLISILCLRVFVLRNRNAKQPIICQVCCLVTLDDRCINVVSRCSALCLYVNMPIGEPLIVYNYTKLPKRNKPTHQAIKLKRTHFSKKNLNNFYTIMSRVILLNIKCWNHRAN